MRRLVIPALELDTKVVEAPFVDRTWDISELGGKIAWLAGTAWPSQAGNTALAGHITARGIGEGPFRYLHRLKTGDEVRIYTAAYAYIYRVREQVVVKIEDVHVLAPTEHPQLTLLTCTNWDEKLLEYRNRRVVFADLVRVVPVDGGS
jgi:sortase A